MSYEKVKQAANVKIGLKQSIKAVKQGLAAEVIVAEDADPHMIQKVAHVCQEHHVPVRYVNSMGELGKTCGIDVGAASVVIEKR